MSLFTLTTQGTTSGTITARAFNAAGTAYAAAQSASGSHPTFWVARSALSVGDTDTGRVVWYEDGAAIATEEFDAAVSSRSTFDHTANNVTASNMRGTDNALLASSYTAPDNAGISTAATEASGANTKAGTILGKFSGITSLLGLFRVIARKDGADATALGEIGGTYGDTTDSLEAIRDRGDAAWTGDANPTGPWTTIITVEDVGGTPLAGVDVAVSGTGAQRWTGTTDANGELQIGQGDGAYTIVADIDGYQMQTVGQSYNVNGADASVTVGMEQTVITSPSSPSLCTCVLKVVNASGVAQEGTTLTFTVSTIPTSDTTGEWYGHVATATSDANGDIEIELPRTAVVEVTQNDVSTVKEYTIPDAASTTLGSFAAIPT